MATANDIPFTEKEIVEKMEVVRYWVKQIETLESHSSNIQTIELKEAYALVYNDYKWKILLAIRDLWFWFLSTEKTMLPPYFKEGGNVPEESRPPTENASL
jgi:hypothetical protein